MSITWNLDKVYKNMEESGIKDASKLLVVDGKVNPMTLGVIMSTAAVGKNSITTKNFKDFHQRIKKLEIVGSTLLKREQDGESIERNPTLPEIKAHIGLTTNVPTMDKKKFNNQLMQIIDNRVQELIKVELDELKEMESQNDPITESAV